MNGKQLTMRSAALAALCLVLGLAAAAAAQPGPGAGRGPGDGSGPGERFGRLYERLDLTAEQREQLGKLRETGRAEGLALRKELQRLRHELEGELLEDAPEGKAVEQFAMRIGEAQGKLQAHRLRQRLAMRALLTPEQRDRLLTLGEGRGMRGEGRGGRHFGAPGRDHGRGAGRGHFHGRAGGPDGRPFDDCPLHGDGI